MYKPKLYTVKSTNETFMLTTSLCHEGKVTAMRGIVQVDGKGEIRVYAPSQLRRIK